MRLEPSTSPPRGNGARRQRVTLALSLMAVATSAYAAYRATRPTSPLAIEPMPARAVAVPTPAPAPPPILDEPDDDDEPPPVPIGSCADPVIASLVRPTTAADAAALRALLAEWRRDPSAPGPGIAHRRGVMYVQSEEDRGDDPPYPRSADPEASRVCGSPTEWLHAEVRRNLAFRELSCEGNVCCYESSEYAPRGYLVFHHGPGDDAPWTLDAWIEVHVAALMPGYADANRSFVTRAIAQLASTSCPGEPDRVD